MTMSSDVQSTVNLEQWVNATSDTRMRWMQDGVQLDDTSSQVLSWCLAFKRQGALISDDAMVAVFQDRATLFQV